MNELLNVKVILETQIDTTRGMIKDSFRQLDDTEYRNRLIARLEAKIDAWKATLEAVEKEIGWAEIENEKLKIFEVNNASTYGLA